MHNTCIICRMNAELKIYKIWLKNLRSFLAKIFPLASLAENSYLKHLYFPPLHFGRTIIIALICIENFEWQHLPPKVGRENKLRGVLALLALARQLTPLTNNLPLPLGWGYGKVSPKSTGLYIASKYWALYCKWNTIVFHWTLPSFDFELRGTEWLFHPIFDEPARLLEPPKGLSSFWGGDKHVLAKIIKYPLPTPKIGSALFGRRRGGPGELIWLPELSWPLVPPRVGAFVLGG